ARPVPAMLHRRSASYPPAYRTVPPPASPMPVRTFELKLPLCLPIYENELCGYELAHAKSPKCLMPPSPLGVGNQPQSVKRDSRLHPHDISRVPLQAAGQAAGRHHRTRTEPGFFDYLLDKKINLPQRPAEKSGLQGVTGVFPDHC